ncbi:uncharacterized protein B4U79_10390 [Dinothrombium tinctorium]|uniref:Uncharacterized protein n=1 Tax=Dinothrombium tinctorium TaxID=1965070 RepID=A0A443QXD2_9ACAR|nr:uncharacterized protein B4U79_10390 [Dinothrombium tinctorium]
MEFKLIAFGFFLLFSRINAFVLNENSSQSEVPTFRVTTIYSPPWITDRDAKLSGFLVAMLDAMKQYSNFEYELNLAKDGRYGAPDANGTYDGMIGELMRGEADLAVADLTLTEMRSKVIDFSIPFISTGIGLIVKRPPYFLDLDAVETTNETVIGEEVHRPMVFYPVSSIADLPKQNIVKYGAVDGGSTLQFLTTTKDPEYHKLSAHLLENKDDMPKSYTEAVQRVIQANGKYAFFMEGTSADYYLGTTCDLIQLGDLIHHRVYAIGLPKNSKYKSTIDRAILHLHETGKLAQLKNDYFPPPSACYVAFDSVYSRSALRVLREAVEE